MMIPASTDLSLSPAPLRLLVVDKVAVLSSLRERYQRLVDQAAIDLTLLSPRMWVENFTPVPYQVVERESFRRVLGKVAWPGREQPSFYISGLLRAFRNARPDVILMMEESFSLFGLQIVLLRRILAPSALVIFYSNNITSYDRYAYRPSWFYQLLGKFVMQRCDAAFCVNNTAEGVLRRARFHGRIRTLFYGINERLFAPRSQMEARREIGIAPETDLFLYAGRLLHLKGIQDLVDALFQLRERMPDRLLRLVIVGSGEYHDRLRDLVAARGLDDVVDFHAMVPIERMPTFVAAATALVLPSRAEINEQFGRVIAEAMLMKVPVIGSTSGGIPEVIGDGGFVFTAGDVDDLVRCMVQVLNNPEEVDRRRDLARRKALKDYSMHGFVFGVIEFLEQLVSRELRQEDPV